MHYCYFYGGDLDGWVCSHPDPGTTFPAPGFCPPGQAQLPDTIQVTYNLFQQWPGPIDGSPRWHVYLHVQTETPAPEALWRRLMPYVLGTTKPPAG